MTTEDLFIIAIELGSSNVTGIAGKRMPDGSISVQTVVQEPSSMFIRRGMIFNLTKSAQSVKSIIERLEGRLKRNITQVYVGYGGQSLRSMVSTVSMPLGGEVPITKEQVDQLLNDNLNVDLGNHSILDVVPQEYTAGKEKSNDPVGIIADRLEGRYLNIIARNSLKTNIEACFSQAGIHVAGYQIIPISEADLLLSEAEKRSGCVFVDFGADTTSVVIYKDNILRYIAVIPLGSANITKDLMSCQLDENEAEHLKISIGSADNEGMTLDQGKEIVAQLPDHTGLTKLKLCEIVEARANEILINVAQQIKESGMDKTSLIGGAVLAGGGSNLRNLASAFTKATGISQIRQAKTVSSVHFAKNAVAKLSEDRLVAAISLIDGGVQNCCGPEFGENHGDIFSGPDGQTVLGGTAPNPVPATPEGGAAGNSPSGNGAETEEDANEGGKRTGKGPSKIRKFGHWLKGIGNQIVGEDE